jgi:hypothetical protein
MTILRAERRGRAGVRSEMKRPGDLRGGVEVGPAAMEAVRPPSVRMNMFNG